MIHHQRTIARLVMASTLALAAACGGDAANDTTMADTMGASTIGAAGDTMAGAAGAMDDNMIVGMMSGANGAEIAAGQVAAEKAQNQEVRQFATSMVEEHQRLQGQVDSVVAILNLERAPVPDSLSQHLEQARQQLTSQAAGAEFDRMYMEHQVRDHQNTLNALQSVQNAVQNERLRTVVTGAIPAVQEHLERARTILQNLGA